MFLRQLRQALVLVAVASSIAACVRAQLLSAQFTQCLESAAQAPEEQKLNINRVYAQLDTGRESGGSDGDNTDHQALLRLVALGETGVQSQGFSNETNYLATLVVETSILSFVPHSNQTSLCSSIITAAELIDGNSNVTAAEYPDPGGCPYGPGPILIGYKVPLGDIGLQDYYPLSTLSTRLRVLDTSVPPLQLACIDVHTTPYYADSTAATSRDKSVSIYHAILWIPIATFIAYVCINLIARIYAALSLTREEREAALASSLTVKLTDPTKIERLREILLETAVGRSVIRSRSLTRFITPGVGDVLGLFQWIAMIGMCSVVWQGYAYSIFSTMAWSMLAFNTTLISPSAEHTDPAYSAAWYPPRGFRYNSDSLFDTPSSPFYFSAQQSHSNLLNIPATGAYNMTNATSSDIYPSQSEVQGIASFSAILGLRPQDLFANCLTFFAILLAGALLVSLIPAAIVYVLRSSERTTPSAQMARDGRGVASEDSEASHRPHNSTYELSRTRLQSSTGRSEIDSATGSATYGKEQILPNSASYASDEGRISQGSHKYMQAPTTPGVGTHVEEYIEPRHLPPNPYRPSTQRAGIVRWWAGDRADRTRAEEVDGTSAHGSSLAVSSYVSTRAWLAFCQGLVVRLVCFFHLPITILSVYQLAHATSTSSVISTVFAAMVFCLFSLGIPIFLVFRIRRTLTRYLQDDTNTLLAFGPVYNTYAQDSYTFAAVRFTANLIEGCVVGGAQNRGTVQVAVILAVEIVETLVTSIWLPWADGAAQGPLQFILSVSRIIISVLLIVIAPAVNLSFTARGWIGYVIVLLAALMVLMILGILLVKIVELLFRLIARVDFDESRSTRNTGFMGALRKKEIIGAGRQRRRGKKGHSKAKAYGGTEPNTSTRASQAFTSRASRASFADQADYETGYLSPANRMARPSYGREGEDETEHIMSAFQSRLQSMAYGPSYYDTGYVPPGSYAAVSAQPQGPGGFHVVRGGRATDNSPYTMNQTLPPGAAPQALPGHQPSMAGFGPDGLPQDRSIPPPLLRARASSQSALVEELPPSPNMPTTPTWHRRVSAIETSPKQSSGKADRRLSAPLPLSPSTFPSGAPISSASTRPVMPREPSASLSQGWKRESSTGSGFFSSLFKGPTKSEENEDAWSDSDESDDGQQRNNALRRRWLFGKGKNKGTSAEAGVREEAEPYEPDPEWEEALAEDDAEDEQDGTGESPPAKGFQVIRRPMPGPRAPAE